MAQTKNQEKPFCNEGAAIHGGPTGRLQGALGVINTKGRLKPTFLRKMSYSQANIHNFSTSYFIPLAIISVMSSLSLGQLKAIGVKPIVVFASGSLFIAVFPTNTDAIFF